MQNLPKCLQRVDMKHFLKFQSKSFQIASNQREKRTAMLSVLNGQSRTKSHAHSIVEHLSALSDFASQACARRRKLLYFFKTRRLTTRADMVST
jgi:hypothetical protein